MVVGKYYKDEEEEERRRREVQKEYDDMRGRGRGKEHSKERGESATSASEKAVASSSSSTSSQRPISNELSAVSTGTEYYLQRIYVQMGKNANMMSVLWDTMTKPDFPRKVQLSGGRILDNVGPTAERTAGLMRDVFDMWCGWGRDVWEGGGGGEGGFGRGGDGASAGRR